MSNFTLLMLLIISVGTPYIVRAIDELVDYLEKRFKKNNIMRKFKHKHTNHIATEIRKGIFRVDDLDYDIPVEALLEKYWEEIIEKDYEILEYYHLYDQRKSDTEKLIKSVKRLSDGEIFTIGDQCRFEIKEFHISKDTIIAKGSSTSNTLNWSSPLCNLAHTKNPLFTTEDGVEIYDGDRWWVVNNISWSKPYISDGTAWISLDRSLRRFSTKEAAEEYVLMNKPCLSLNDLEGIIDQAGCPMSYNSLLKFREKSKWLVKQRIK